MQHVDPFTLLVAVVLSAQATDAGVNKATPALFAAADTPAKMAKLGEAKVRDYIKTIGLFRTKAKNVVALSRKLDRASMAARFRASREALEALPGVGRKTANVVLNVAFGEPTIAVDTHIFRVGNRTGLATGKTPFEVSKSSTRWCPTNTRRYAHHWLILHGRYICVARRPLCEKCPIADLCKWPGKTVLVATGTSRLLGEVPLPYGRGWSASASACARVSAVPRPRPQPSQLAKGTIDRPVNMCRCGPELSSKAPPMRLRTIVIAVFAVLVSFGGATLAMRVLAPDIDRPPPALAAVPPLPPVTRSSTIVAPAAIALTAIRDAMEQAAPRDLSGKRGQSDRTTALQCRDRLDRRRAIRSR